MSKAPTYLVTGAAGFIAYHLIDSLLSDGIDVVGIDNFDPYYALTLKQKNLNDLQATATKTGASFEFFKADILDAEGLAQLPEGITAVIHLAAKAGVRPSLMDPMGYQRTNVEGTANMLEWARLRGIQNFVFGSSSSVYGNDSAKPFSEDSICMQPLSPYAASKRAGELLCFSYSHLYRMKIASLRFFTVYGPRQRPDLVIRKFIEALQENRPITLFGNGQTARDYTFVTDIVSGIRSAVRKTEDAEEGFNQIYNLGGNQTVTLLQLVDLIEKHTGIKAERLWDKMQPGDVDITSANIQKSATELGYAPKTTIDDGIRKAVEWHQQKLNLLSRGNKMTQQNENVRGEL